MGKVEKEKNCKMLFLKKKKEKRKIYQKVYVSVLETEPI